MATLYGYTTGPNSIEKTVEDCLETTSCHIVVHSLMEASLRDDNTGAYLGGMITAVRDGPLITCGEGVEDILIYLMEISSPLSDLCKYFDPHSRISEETP